jgi:hypothetical protein
VDGETNPDEPGGKEKDGMRKRNGETKGPSRRTFLKGISGILAGFRRVEELQSGFFVQICLSR